MRGYDRWKTTPPPEPLEIEWEADMLEDSNEYHQCEDCSRFLSHTPDNDSADTHDDFVEFDFTCNHCGVRNVVTVYPHCLSPE